MKYSFVLLVLSALVSGCFAGPHAVNIQKAENLGSPQNIEHTLKTLQTVFGAENSKAFDSGNLVKVFVGSARNAYGVERALENLCNRMFPKTRFGRPASSSSIQKDVYLGYDLGIPIPISKHFAQGISTLNQQLAPDSELTTKIGRRAKYESRFHYCPSYPQNGIVHINFGWQLVKAQDNTISFLEKFWKPQDHHVLIARSGYFNPLIEKYKSEYNAHVAKKDRNHQEAILKAEESRRKAEEQKEESQEQERRGKGI